MGTHGDPCCSAGEGGAFGHDYVEHVRTRSRRSLTAALVLIAGFMMAEVVGGIISGSLALLADAGHMLTDAASIGLALLAMHFANRAASAKRTFGYRRLEILAALANALTLWAVSVWIVIEAWQRFSSTPEVRGGLMLAIGSVGLLVNLGAAWILHRPAKDNLNVEGAFQHVMADLLGSVAVVVSGALVLAFGWHIADPILSVLIGILILVSAWRLLARVVHVLLEGTPDHVDVHRLCGRFEATEGVTAVHDVHIWTLSSGYDALTAHVMVEPGYSVEDGRLLERLRRIAYEEFRIQHVTLQLERNADLCNEDHHMGRLDPMWRGVRSA